MNPTGHKPIASTASRATLVLLLLLLGPSLAFSQGASAPPAPIGFEGRWDLTVHDMRGDYPSWIEVHRKGEAVAVLFVGRIGSAQNVEDASIAGDTLAFSVPPDDAANPPQKYRATLRNGSLSGQVLRPGRPDVPWTGKRAPALSPLAVVRWGPPHNLFDAKSFTGWHFSSAQHSNWSVTTGTLRTVGRGADLISDSRSQDLQLHLEWRCSEKANSGVYLRGRYEVQIETDSASEPASHHTAGVYGFLAPHPEQPRTADVWQSFDLELVGRFVTVRQNGVVVIDHQPIPGITGGALDSDEAAPGPIVLQGGEDGTVEFRNVRLRLPQTAKLP